MFDGTSMVKPMDSQWMKSEKINRISQQVEGEATLLSSDRSVSFEITLEVRQNGDHVADEDADDDEDQGQIMRDVQDSAVGRTQKIHVSPFGSLQT